VGRSPCLSIIKKERYIMTAWANVGGSYNQYDMASDGYKLVVTKDGAAQTAVTANNDNAGGLALDVNGRADVEFNGEGTTLHVKNTHINNPIELALHVEGLVKIQENAAAGLDLLTIANSTLAGGGLNCQCPVQIDRTIKFTGGTNPSFIDSADDVPLHINAGSAGHLPGDVNLGGGLSGANTNVLGSLQVTGTSDLNDTVDLDANVTGVAIDGNNANTGTSATAIKATGIIALDARGRIDLASDKKLSMDGNTGSNYLIFSSANSRIEFYIGGTLHFYIDDHGGHNA
jgi:hypothetical protein